MQDQNQTLVKIDQENGIIDLYDAQNQKNGWFGLQFYLTEANQVVSADQGKTETKSDHQIIWQGQLVDQVFLKLDISTSKTGLAKVVQPTIINNRSESFCFNSYGFKPAEGKNGVQLAGGHDRTYVYAHPENLRHEEYPHFTGTHPFIRALPVSPYRFGNSPSNPIPALLIGRSGKNSWLLEGAATQNRHLLSWQLSLPPESGGPIYYRNEFSWNGIAQETVDGNSQLELEAILYRIVESGPDQFYDPYMEELQQLYQFQGPSSRLDQEPVFCTWNYNVFTNVSEEICLKRMEVVKELQGKGFFQIDHGYQPQITGESTPLKGILADGDDKDQTPATPNIDAYYPDCQNAWDTIRFPSGPKGFVEACRNNGLRPAIWWSPRVAEEGIINREHPEWILHGKDGKPIKHGHLLLDLTVPEAREFVEKCVKTIAQEWGFEGMKLDFFSWTFDSPEARFRFGNTTGVELKRWFFQMIRSYFGPKGYFLHCISAPLGNPFLAIDGFDSFRAGIDIHSGEWEYHLRSVRWLLPTILACNKSTWYPNIDSCMGDPNFNPDELRSRLAYAYITSGMLEFSGPVELFNDTAREDYRILANRCDQGGKVRCPDSDAFYGRPFPKILIRDHEPASRTQTELGYSKTVAFFNWGDDETAISLPISKLVDNYPTLELRDFWSGEQFKLQDNLITVLLPPRGHQILDVKTD